MIPRYGGRLSTPSNEPQSKDLLHGATAITEFLNEISAVPINRSKVYRLIEAEDLPVGRLGVRLLVGSKKRISEYFERLTRGG